MNTRFTFTRSTLAALGFLAVLAAPQFASAQGQGPGGGGRGMGMGMGMGMMGGGGGTMLLSNKSVQKELKLADDQAEKLAAFAQETMNSQREEMRKLADLSDDERREKMREMSRLMNEKVQKTTAEVLKPEQLKRFEQIQVQQAGMTAFNMPRVQKALKIDDDQKTKFTEVARETNASMREAAQGMQDDREAAMKKIGEIRKDAMTKTFALMTPEQTATWKELTGEPFEVKMERPMGRERP